MLPQLALAAHPYSCFFMRLGENQQLQAEEAKFFRVPREDDRMPFSERLAFYPWRPQRVMLTSYLHQDPPFFSIS